jgi:glycosyltransferase involved in cell wall biosynthesis
MPHDAMPLERQIEDLRAALETLQGQLSWMESALDASKAALPPLLSEVGGLEQALTVARARIESLERRLAATEEASRAADTLQTARADALSHALAARQRALDEAVRRANGLEQALQEQQHTAMTLRVALAAARGEASRVVQSKTWRLTAPARRLGALAGKVSSRGQSRRALALLRSSDLFDAAWYLRQYPDVAAAGEDPVDHYFHHGAREGRDPGPRFSTLWYLAHYTDVAAAGVNPLIHYLEHGALEGRSVQPPTAPRGGAQAAPLPPDPAELQRFEALRPLLATGALNACWYGGERLEPSELPALSPGQWEALRESAQALDAADTARLAAYAAHDGPDEGGAPPGLLRSLVPHQAIAAALSRTKPPPGTRPSSDRPSFSVVTPFHRHLKHFAACAQSVWELARRSQGAALEWLVLNDDPGVSREELTRLIPEGLRARVLSDGANRGIVARLNQGITEAQHEWVLFLDCDDLIAPDAAGVLARYIARFPLCRYISSGMADLAEDGALLRYRLRDRGPAGLLSDGMTAGHLKAVRRDAFEAYGLLEEAFQGCQDYDFALRMAFAEPLLYIPEVLYSYRWHTASQSVAQSRRQTRIAGQVVRHHVRRFLAGPGSAGEAAPAPVPLAQRGAAILRTQGTRNELLREAVASVLSQDPPMAPVVVVHGDASAHSEVTRAVAPLGERVVVLHASDLRRRRGYPLNLALQHLYDTDPGLGFLAFLDDDDIFYPFFSKTMTEALAATGADLVHAASNKRVPWVAAEPAYQPLPAPCLLAGNFIPINAYAVRFERLRVARVLFDEQVDYLEDWGFLVRCLDAGLRFQPIHDVLSEFRIVSDGNSATKQKPALWARSKDVVLKDVACVLERYGKRALLAQLFAFPGGFESAGPFELELLEETRKLLCDGGSL